MQQPPVRDDGLQIEEHRSFQRAFWTAERWVWLIFCVLLLLALMGLTGAGGYFARSAAELAGGSVQYPAITRWGYLDQMQVRLRGPERTRRLHIASTFLEYFQIEDLAPQPARALGTGTGTTFEFDADDGEPIEVVLHVRALRPGFPRYSLAIGPSATECSTAILP